MATLTWGTIESECDDATCVQSYEITGDGITITWCDGSEESFAAPESALEAIQMMSRT